MSAVISFGRPLRGIDLAMIKQQRRADLGRLLREWRKSSGRDLAALIRLFCREICAIVTFAPVLLVCHLGCIIGHDFDKVAYSTMQRRRSARKNRVAAWKRLPSSVVANARWRIRNFNVYRELFAEDMKFYSPAAKHGANSSLVTMIPKPRPKQAITSVVMIAIVATLGAQFVSSGTASAKINVVAQSKQQDLSVPRWASAVRPWQSLVNKVSHSPSVIVSHNQRQTNILSESVFTVTNTDKVAMRRYTPGQERLLYLFVLLGSNGKADAPNGLCPLSADKRRKVAAMAGLEFIKDSNMVDAEKSLTSCGYLINALADQLINSPAATRRYAGSVPTAFAYDLAYNWVNGTVAARKMYANNFAQLYADWNKPASATYAKLRKE